MDGLVDVMLPEVQVSCQHTLKSAISCVGTGLHSGLRVGLVLRPAAPDTGIRFRRTDLGHEFAASYESVCDTKLCTQLSAPGYPEVRVGTVEHLMAALSACGIDNVVVALDGPEVPVMDGSSAAFMFLIDCAGRETQDAKREAIEVLRPVRVEQGAAFAELRPGGACLELSMSIDFAAAAIGRQALSMTLSESRFRGVLANARTFTLRSEVESLHAAGLAQGGSLDNAIVVDGAAVLNPGGLRSPDEFVRHKMLDAVGDLALAGARLHGRFVAHCSGHTLNNALLRKLFADRSAWRVVSLEEPGWAGYGFAARAAA